jgi:hypothetical protein
VGSVDIELAAALPQFAARSADVVAGRRSFLVCSHAIANFVKSVLLRVEMAGAEAEGLTWRSAGRWVKIENGDETCVLEPIRNRRWFLFSVICRLF